MKSGLVLKTTSNKHYKSLLLNFRYVLDLVVVELH